MKEKCKLYFVFYGHKLCKVNLINAVVSKKSSFKVDIRQTKQDHCSGMISRRGAKMCCLK